MVKDILYISYDGMLEPLGQSQVLAYLKHLVLDRRIHLISFEKPEDLGNVTEFERLADGRFRLIRYDDVSHLGEVLKKSAHGVLG